MQSDFSTLREKTEILNTWFTPSEMQGIICASIAFAYSDIAKILLTADTAEVEDLVEEIMEETESALQNSDLDFQLTLDDDALAQERAEQFVLWINSFLSALDYLILEKQLKITDKQIQDYINDLREFSKLDTRLQPSDANLTMLLNLEEYCRMGVLMIYACYNKTTA